MLWSLLTCPATHAAVCALMAAADPAGALARGGLPGEAVRAVRAEVPVSSTAVTTTTAAASMQTATSSASRGRRSRGTRRAVHRLMVVASTRPHEGARGGAFGAAVLTAPLV